MSTFVADRDIRDSEEDRESLRDEVARRADHRTACGAIRQDLQRDLYRCARCLDIRRKIPAACVSSSRQTFS